MMISKELTKRQIEGFLSFKSISVLHFFEFNCDTNNRYLKIFQENDLE